MSRHTSLVAIDVTPSAPAGLALAKTAVPGNLPDGQSFEAIFGGLPQTATRTRLDAIVAFAALLAAAVLFFFARVPRAVCGQQC